MTRLEAKAAGETFYFNGVACKRGHVSKRRVANWTCFECEQLKRNFRSHIIHGGAIVGNRVPEYNVWQAMRNRCNTPSATGYHRYGGRGIRVCRRWDSFANFLADMGKRPTPKHQIDRIDVNGHYEQGNCRWVTKEEQMRNTRVTRFVTLNGKTLSVAGWAEELGISADTIRVRLLRGKSPAEALRIPQ